jgi:hypothetical protein
LRLSVAPDLAAEISLGAFFDRAGDLFHAIVARRGGKDRLDEVNGEDQPDHRAAQGQRQPRINEKTSDEKRHKHSVEGGKEAGV